MTNVVTNLSVPIKEVPITFIERKHGSSKMSLEIAYESFLRVTLWGMQKRLRNLSR
jgi:dolichol-phosphate mannosyltransferase